MRAWFVAALIFLTMLSSPAAAASRVPNPAAIRRGLEATAAGRYQDALGIFGCIVADAPGRPEGYFFRAAVYQLMNGHFERPAFREGLERDAGRAIALATDLLKRHPGDARLLLVSGLSNGMLAVYAIHQSHYISAFLQGRKMLRLLDRALAIDPRLEDAYYALGVYHIILSRSPWVRLLALFTGDTAEEGLADLRRVVERGDWLKTLARVELVWALYKEERFEEGRRALAPLLARYPDNPLYGLAYAEGYFMAGDYVRARREYAALEKRLGAKKDDYARLYAHFAEWRVVRCDFALGRYARAGAGARAVLEKPDMNSTLLRQVRTGAASMIEFLKQAELVSAGGADGVR